MNETTISEPAGPGESKRRVGISPRVRGPAIAAGGMILGGLIGFAVEFGIESTGVLGPSVTDLLAEQEANFEDLHARLEQLRNAASDPVVIAGIDELQALVEKQGSLQQGLNGEIALLNAQLDELKQASLAANGFAGGAGLWLKAGESISLGDRNHVLGVTRINRGSVDVNLNGESSRLTVGDTVGAATAGGDCEVFYRQATPREDGRVGFDIVCG